MRIEDGLRYDFWVLMAPQREQVFVILVDKVKIVEDIKHTKHERKKRGLRVRKRGMQVLLVSFSTLRNRRDLIDLLGLRHW